MKIIKALIFIFPLIFINCFEEQCDPGPHIGEMKVRVTINNENPEVHVVIFQGKIEKHDTLISERINHSPVYYNLEAGQYYSGTARYISGIREIIAIDGKTMQTSTDDNNCESAENFTLNLKLVD